jgi:hypothetical protein
VNACAAALLHGQVAPDVAGFFPQHRSTYIPLNSPPVVSERVPLFAAEITRLEEVFQAQQSGHVPMHEVDANDARARLWSVAAFNRMLKL